MAQTLNVLKVALDPASFLATSPNYPSPFHMFVARLLATRDQSIIDPRPILEDFINHFVDEDPGIEITDSLEVQNAKRRAALDRTEASKRSFRTQQQFGEAALDLLKDCPYFESIKIKTRQRICRENCRVNCPDADDPNDPNKYDIPVTYSEPQSMVVFPIPMPRRNHTVESTFLYSFDRVDNHNKRCRNCNGIKKQTNQLQLDSMPFSIIIGLNRGIPNANGRTIDKDETKVLLDKEFELEMPNRNPKTFKLVATSQHTGSYYIH